MGSALLLGALRNPRRVEVKAPLASGITRHAGSVVLKAPSADRNHRLAAIRFLINRWSCSMTLFK
jgi:hypothetical protein